MCVSLFVSGLGRRFVGGVPDGGLCSGRGVVRAGVVLAVGVSGLGLLGRGVEAADVGEDACQRDLEALTGELREYQDIEFLTVLITALFGAIIGLQCFCLCFYHAKFKEWERARGS